MYAGALSMSYMPWFFTGVAVSANTLMTAAAGILFVRPFLGRPPSSQAPVKEASAVLSIGPLLLGGTGILFGIIPWWVAKWLVQPAIHVLGHDQHPVELALFHGWNMPLLLSIVTLSVGIICYLGRARLSRTLVRIGAHWPVTADRAYQVVLGGVARMGGLQSRLLQNGSLHRYLFLVIATFVGLCAWRLWVARLLVLPARLPSLALREWLLVGLETAAVAAVRSFLRTLD